MAPAALHPRRPVAQSPPRIGDLWAAHRGPVRHGECGENASKSWENAMGQFWKTDILGKCWKPQQRPAKHLKHHGNIYEKAQEIQ